MSGDNPFRKVPGELARDREERLFDFLVEQLAGVRESAWRAYAAESEDVESVAYTALLLSNLSERLSPGSSDALDALARKMLGDRLSVGGFSTWLKRGEVDVNRLAGFLNHAVSQAA